jgi:hypothetical protein
VNQTAKAAGQGPAQFSGGRPGPTCPRQPAPTPTTIIAPDARRRGGRDGKWGWLRDDQLYTLWLLHRERGLSVRELGRQLHATGRYGFASPKSASMAMCYGWARLELPALDRVTATRRASTTHGYLPRKGKQPGAKRKAREWRAEHPPTSQE